MTRRIWIPVVVLMAMLGGMAYGQQGPAGGRDGGGRRGGGGGGGFDPAEMRQRMEQRMRESMGATDDEWKVLQPKIEKVQTLQRESMSARFGGFGGRRGGPGGDNAANAPSNPVSDAANALRTALEDKNTSADVLKQKLQALRDARNKAKEQLTAAQNELKELLSARQEAALVSAGVLE